MTSLSLEQEDQQLVHDVAEAFTAAEQAEASLQQLCGGNALDAQWSSDVTRAQSRVSDSITACDKLLNELEAAVDEETHPAYREALASHLEAMRARRHALQQLRQVSGQALVHASARAYQHQRKQLVSGALTPRDIRQGKTGADAVAASQSITAGLRQTAKVMAEEIEASATHLTLINTTTHKLSAAGTEYSDQHGKLDTSEVLLKKIRWQHRRERFLMYCGLAFFSLVVVYVLLKRTAHFIPALPALPSLPKLRGAGPTIDDHATQRPPGGVDEPQQSAPAVPPATILPAQAPAAASVHKGRDDDDDDFNGEVDASIYADGFRLDSPHVLELKLDRGKDDARATPDSEGSQASVSGSLSGVASTTWMVDQVAPGSELHMEETSSDRSASLAPEPGMDANTASEASSSAESEPSPAPDTAEGDLASGQGSEEAVHAVEGRSTYANGGHASAPHNLAADEHRVDEDHTGSVADRAASMGSGGAVGLSDRERGSLNGDSSAPEEPSTDAPPSRHAPHAESPTAESTSAHDEDLAVDAQELQSSPDGEGSKAAADDAADFSDQVSSSADTAGSEASLLVDFEEDSEEEAESFAVQPASAQLSDNAEPRQSAGDDQGSPSSQDLKSRLEEAQDAQRRMAEATASTPTDPEIAPTPSDPEIAADASETPLEEDAAAESQPANVSEAEAEVTEDPPGDSEAVDVTRSEASAPQDGDAGSVAATTEPAEEEMRESHEPAATEIVQDEVVQEPAVASDKATAFDARISPAIAEMDSALDVDVEVGDEIASSAQEPGSSTPEGEPDAAATQRGIDVEANAAAAQRSSDTEAEPSGPAFDAAWEAEAARVREAAVGAEVQQRASSLKTLLFPKLRTAAVKQALAENPRNHHKARSVGEQRAAQEAQEAATAQAKEELASDAEREAHETRVQAAVDAARRAFVARWAADPALRAAAAANLSAAAAAAEQAPAFATGDRAPAELFEQAESAESSSASNGALVGGGAGGTDVGGFEAPQKKRSSTGTSQWKTAGVAEEVRQSHQNIVGERLSGFGRNAAQKGEPHQTAPRKSIFSGKSQGQHTEL